MWWYSSLDAFGYEIDIFHISCAIALLSLIILVLESGAIVISFARITTSNMSVNVNTSFLNIMMLCFSLKTILQGMAKITLLKNKSMQNFRRHWSMRQRENSQKRNCKVYRYKLQSTVDLNYKLQLLASEYIFLWIIFCYF